MARIVFPQLRAAMPLVGAAILALGLAGPNAAQAQTFPSKTVRIIVPFSPGSILDTLARLVATKSSEDWGQAVVVENRGGAGGRTGSEMVARSAPDGHTILLGSAGTHIGVIFLSKNLPYDPFKDFTPITLAVEPFAALVAHPSVPANNVKELIDYARKNPGKLAYATNGVGTVFHIMGEVFKHAAGIDMLHVPLQGAGDVLNQVLGGHVQIALASAVSIPNYVNSGKLRAIGIVTSTRYPDLPKVPTITEQLPKYESPGTWLGFFGPANLPGPVLARINQEFVRALTSPDVRPKLDQGGMLVVANSPQQFTEAIKKTYEIYGRAAKLANLQPE
jgi:tripartite-type tricarboxylate transporter receptor subunit TctC